MSPYESPDFQRLLAEIRLNPEDDLPRSILADWLEEQGEGERAEFIRLQCELDRTPEFFRRERVASADEWRQYRVGLFPLDMLAPTFKFNDPARGQGLLQWREANPRFAVLKSRETELLGQYPLNDRNAIKWSALPYALARRIGDLSSLFRRGFIDTLQLQEHDWSVCSKSVLSRHPIRKVHLEPPEGESFSPRSMAHHRETWPEIEFVFAGTDTDDTMGTPSTMFVDQVLERKPF